MVFTLITMKYLYDTALPFATASLMIALTGHLSNIMAYKIRKNGNIDSKHDLLTRSNDFRPSQVI